LLAANQELFVVYVLRDALRELWRHREPQQVLRAWYSRYYKATCSGIAPLVRLARHLRPYLPGIKVIKRMAYGFRDDTYFFLKIRAAFPGVGR
jgi:transposase